MRLRRLLQVLKRTLRVVIHVWLFDRENVHPCNVACAPRSIVLIRNKQVTPARKCVRQHICNAPKQYHRYQKRRQQHCVATRRCDADATHSHTFRLAPVPIHPFRASAQPHRMLPLAYWLCTLSLSLATRKRILFRVRLHLRGDRIFITGKPYTKIRRSYFSHIYRGVNEMRDALAIHICLTLSIIYHSSQN